MEIEENFTKLLNHKITQKIVVYGITTLVLMISWYVFIALMLISKGFIYTNLNSAIIIGIFALLYLYITTKIFIITVKISKETLIKINNKV